jgi:hypothetical protein
VYAAGSFAKRVACTVEGDAITRYYSVLGPGRVESLVDATLDRFGVRQWHRAICTGVSLTLGGSLELRDCIHSTLPATFPSR